MLKRWKVTLTGNEYTIELEHRAWTNTQKVSINGQMVFTSPGRLHLGGVTCFRLDGQECAVIITNRVIGFAYDLVVNDVSIDTRKKVKYIATQPVATATNGMVQKIDEASEKK